MKTQLILVIFLSILSSSLCTAQQNGDKLDYIAFRLYHSLRIPNQSVSIELIKRQKETFVKVKSNPLRSDKKWEHSIIDTSFVVEKDVFIELANQVIELNKTNLSKALGGGLDGTTCSIEFGSYSSSVTYKFWTPDYKPKERGLAYFLKLCRRLIEIADLDPKEIL